MRILKRQQRYTIKPATVSELTAAIEQEISGGETTSTARPQYGHSCFECPTL